MTRRSIRSVTLADETQTKSDTLVSVPAAAVLGSGTPRSSPAHGGHIVPRDILARMAESEQTDPSPYSIRVVHPSPSQDHSPLLPPPPLDPDGLAGLGIRSQGRPMSDRSTGSHKTQHQSVYSEKSGGSLEADPAELLVAQRVRVGATRTHSRLATIESVSEPSSSRSALGLSGLGARLGRLSWFRRMSSGPSALPTDAQRDAASDPYTRTPPRTSRNGSPRHSRHGSTSNTTRLLDDVDIEAVPVSTLCRQPTCDSGLGLGFLSSGSRPMSSVSAKSSASAGGNTVYHSARSRPGSSVVEFPIPVTTAEEQERLVQIPSGTSAVFAGPPPAYALVEDNSSADRSNRSNRAVATPQSERASSEIDILDIPAPGPSSPFGVSRPVFPPGLVPLPQPQSWRDSYTTVGSSPSSASSAGIAIDILDDTPPAALEGWRDLYGAGERRRTFGMPSQIVQQGDPTPSQHASLQSLPSHLRATPSLSATNSAPSSQHSQDGSASSRPSQRSHLRDASSAITFSDGSEESRHDAPPFRSPPLSAVFDSFGSIQSARHSLARRSSQRLSHSELHQQGSDAPQLAVSEPTSVHQLSAQAPPPAYAARQSSRAPLLGTVSSATSDSHSSVTTAMTDPITGVVMHFPSLPYMRASPQTGAGRQLYDRGSGSDGEHW